MMQIRVELRDTVTVVSVIGDVDGMTAEALLSEFDARVGEGHVNLVAELSGVGYTSSAGLRALLAVLRATRRRGGDLRLAAVRAPVRKVLDISGFSSILQLFDDVDTAVASFRA